jgi:L-malate glycosyltransferase
MAAVVELASQKPLEEKLEHSPQAVPGVKADRSRPVRVCFLIGELAIGGTETQLLALIRHIDRERVQPYLVVLDGENPVSRALEPADCPVLRIGVRRLRSIYALRPAWRLARFLRRERIDVLQPYYQHSTVFGVVVGRLAGVKSIVRTRNNINHWMTSSDRMLGRMLNPFVTVTLCNSEAARNAVLADEKPDPGAVVVIENGVDLERFEHIRPPDPDRVVNSPCRIGMVANLRRVKGVDVFARAAALVAKSHPEVSFHVAGEGPERPKLEQLIGELGLADQFSLHGKVADIPEFLARLDIAVLSSRAEGMPNAVLEYMAAGRPVVAAAVGGATELIEHSVHGLLVRPEDPAQLAEAIGDLVSQPSVAARLGASGRIRATSLFSRAAMANRVQSFYERLCGGASQVRIPRFAPRRLIKSAGNVAALVLTAPLWSIARFQAAATDNEDCFAFGSELLSLVPGRVGIYLRRGYYRMCLDACSNDVEIGFGTTIAHPQVRIGRRVYIGNRCTIGSVVIGDEVAIGSNVDILSGRYQHNFDDLDRPILEIKPTFQQIVVGRNSWIGNSAVIMAEVGEDCIIGAGSVVVKPISDRSVAVGNPSKVVRSREAGNLHRAPSSQQSSRSSKQP